MIRAATLDDLPALLHLGALMHAESPRFSRLRFDAGRLEDTLRLAIEHGFARVAIQGETMIGGMAALASPHWFSPDVVACDLALFMAPEHRGSIAAARLLKSYAQWSREQAAQWTVFNILSGVNEEQTVALCERLGWRRAGVVMEI